MFASGLVGSALPALRRNFVNLAASMVNEKLILCVHTARTLS
jgi:hypothetical protein